MRFLPSSLEGNSKGHISGRRKVPNVKFEMQTVSVCKETGKYIDR